MEIIPSGRITTAKATVSDYIQQAVDKKVIDKSWLEKFNNGTMTRFEDYHCTS